MIKYLPLFSFILTFSFCSVTARKQGSEKPAQVANISTQDSTKTYQISRKEIGNSSGLVVLNEGKDNKDFLHFYNEDGSLWYKFTFYDDDKNGKFEYANDAFRPFAFHVDYFVLALRCVKKENKRYEVIVNEETELKKYVNVDDLSFKFEKWEDHVLKVFAVDFDREQNPLLQAPQDKLKKVPLQHVFFHPVEVQGEWMKVWLDITEKKNKKVNRDYGWIRWRNENRLLVELSYIC